jgi:hypothetical protein
MEKIKKCNIKNYKFLWNWFYFGMQIFLISDNKPLFFLGDFNFFADMLFLVVHF